MTIPNQPTQFRKREVLKAAKLNKALGEFGSQGGVIPYNENGEGDTSHNLPLGTKQNPFGNAYFKGMNVYTQQEAQHLVDSGALTQTDRMVFWNTTINTLCAWDGEKIITLTSGSENSMKYLFGDGRDGDVTMVADGTYNTQKQYNNLTINSYVTITSDRLTPLIIRCKNTLHIYGTLSMVGKGYVSGENGTGDLCVSAQTTKQAKGIDCLSNKTLQAVFDLDFFSLYGLAGGSGAKGQATSSGTGFTSGGMGFTTSGGDERDGGNGGGAIFIYAKDLYIHSGAVISANGAEPSRSGESTTYKGPGGGGGGGLVVLVYETLVNEGGTLSAVGGLGGYASGTRAGSGGDGTVLYLQI